MSGAAQADDAEEVTVRASKASGFVGQATEGETVRTTTDAASLVETLPGVHVRRLGGDDAFSTLSIRGSSSTQVQINLAGIPLTGGAEPTVDLASIPVWPGSSFRVYRSFAPAVYGRGSLGGTLVISPPQGYDKDKIEVFSQLGSLGMARVRVCSIRDLSYAVNIGCFSASRSDGQFDYIDPIVSSARGEPTSVTRQNAGHAEISGLGQRSIPVKFGQITGRFKVTSFAQTRNQHLPGTLRAPTTSLELRSGRGAGALEMALLAGSGTFVVRGWGKGERFALRDSEEEARRTASAARTNDRIFAAGGAVEWTGKLSPRTKFSGVIDGTAEKYMPSTWVLAPTPPGASRNSTGVGFDLEHRVLDFGLSATFRMDQWADFEQSKPASDPVVQPTGHVGVEYTGFGPVRISSHVGRTARPASFVERYGNRGSFLGNDSLRPESAWTADVGIDTAIGKDKERARFEWVLFQSWAQDLIAFIPQGAFGRARAANIGRARIAGLEGLIEARWGPLDLRASYTALLTEDMGQCEILSSTGCERPALPGRPAHDLASTLGWSFWRARVFVAQDFVSGMFADQNQALRVPARFLLSTGARVSLARNPKFDVMVDFKNVLDKRTVQYDGALGSVTAPIGDLYDYPLPGRTVFISARMSYDGRVGP